MDQEREDIVLRVLTMADCARLVRMDHAVSGRNRQSWYEGKLKRALEEADVRISLGAEVDGTLVGALMGSVHYGEFGQPEPVAILDTVLVDPGYSRRGVATAMLETLVRNLAALRIERLRTEVSWDELDLLGFFARAGFVPVPRLVLERPIP